MTPRGIVLTIWQVGNTELQADGYEAVYTVRSANTTRAPLNFTGDWLDQDGKLGSVKITRSSRLLFNTTPCS